MQQEYNKESLTSEDYMKIVEELNDTLDEANQNYIDLLNKYNALQAEYNKVCYQRDVLISILDKVIK